MINESPNCTSFYGHARRRAQLCQRRIHNAFGGTHAALAAFDLTQGYPTGAFSRACVLAVAGLALTATAVLSGCAHTIPASYASPSVKPVASALAGTRCEISKTRDAIAKAADRAKAITMDSVDRQALQAAFTEADEYAQQADKSAALTLTNLGTFNAAVTNQTAQLNKTTDRLNYIEPKYQKAVGLIWKWRLYFLGLAGGLIAYLLLKYGSRLAVTAAAIAAKVP